MIGQRDGFLAKVRAYACAGLISSGPWLMTILTLTLLNLAGPYLGGTKGYALFRALVTYAFAFSLIFTGIGQMAVTRRIADLLYGKEYERVLPAFAATLLVTGLLHAAIAFGFSLWAGFSVTLTCLVVVLFAVIGMTWIALIWLSVARQYDEVLRAYIYGTLVSLVGMVLFALNEGPQGLLGAYTTGQAFIAPADKQVSQYPNTSHYGPPRHHHYPVPTYMPPLTAFASSTVHTQYPSGTNRLLSASCMRRYGYSTKPG